MEIKLKIREEAVYRAVETLVMALKEDAGLYIAYKANIAMAFYDEFKRNGEYFCKGEVLHKISNQAAVNFLKLLCSERGFKRK